MARIKNSLYDSYLVQMNDRLPHVLEAYVKGTPYERYLLREATVIKDYITAFEQACGKCLDVFTKKWFVIHEDDMTNFIRWILYGY